MATDFDIDIEHGIIRISISGFLSVEEMYDTRRRLMIDPAFNRGLSELVDARQVNGVEMNGFTIKAFSQENVLGPQSRRAVVISRTPDTNLVRMFQIYRELAGGSETTEVFSDMDAAMKWLGLPGNYVWR